MDNIIICPGAYRAGIHTLDRHLCSYCQNPVLKRTGHGRVYTGAHMISTIDNSLIVPEKELVNA